jgi:peptidoglycan-associated lipoprotein
MKRAQIIVLIATVAALTATGCHKGPKSPTWLGNSRQELTENPQLKPIQPGDESTRLRPPGSDLTRPLTNPDEGNPLAGRPTGQEDPEVLKAQTIYFEFDKSSIRPNERPKLQAVATYLKNNGKAVLKIEGNCDERGTEEYNRALGERRAIAARDYLVASEHVDSSRITTVSFGEDKPSDPGHNEAAFSKNRRDDFVIVNQP